MSFLPRRRRSGNGNGPDGLPAGFTLVRRLERTNTSDLYLVRRSSLVAEAVLKILLPTADERERELFAEGNRMAQELRHPQIVEVLAVGEGADGFPPWVAMPFYPRGSLNRYVIREAMLPSEEVVHIGVRVAEMLHLLHAARTLHRDVKPGNVLLGEDGESVLTDLNSAGKMHSDRGTLTTDRVSRSYAAPEVLKDGRYSVASEIYSLGVTLVELLMGEPFGRLEWPLRDPLGSPALGDLLDRMVHSDASERPASASDVARELRGVQHDLGMVVTGPTPSREDVPAPVPSEPRSASSGRGLSRRTVILSTAGVGAGAALAATVGPALLRELTDADPSAGGACGRSGPRGSGGAVGNRVKP